MTPTAEYAAKANLAIGRVLLDLADYFHDLDDSDDAPFGEYARITGGPSSLTLHHESEPWGIELILRVAPNAGSGA